MFNLVVLGLLVLAVSGKETAQALQDKITNLPGQPPVNFDQYSGYITLPNNANKNIFYWLQMSDSTRNDIPVMIWTNGGPGCSGLLGCLIEQGAFRVQQNGSLELNPGRWNQRAHMVFIEQPVFVGFSYSLDMNDMTTGDKQAVADMYQFILGFFKVFPSLTSNDFYITSESYGGHYMPQLAKYIVDNNDGSINFKGFMVGNPYTDPVENAKGTYDTFYGHSLVSYPSFKAYQENCKDGTLYNDSKCMTYMTVLEQEAGDIYPYGVDWPVCHSSSNHKKILEKQHFINTVWRELGRGKGLIYHQEEIEDKIQENLGGMYSACATDYETNYLNRQDVQTALHVQNSDRNNSLITWGMCTNLTWNATDFDLYMEPYYIYLINGNYNLHILIYSGDDDTVCGTLGTQSWIWNLGYSNVNNWRNWLINEPQNGEQVGGFYVKFEPNLFTFATVHSAGHQVPWFKPEKSYQLLKNYLDGPF